MASLARHVSSMAGSLARYADLQEAALEFQPPPRMARS